MDEELSEAGADAPASGAVDAPVEAEAVDVASDDAPATSAPSLSDDTESDSALASFPSHDDFGWDDWDGTNNALPEEVHSWADGFKGHYTRLSDDRAAKIEQSNQYTKSLYEAINSGQEDPRVSEFSKKRRLTRNSSGRKTRKFLTTKVLNKHLQTCSKRAGT